MEIFGEPSFDNQKVMDRTVLVGIDAPLPQSWSPGNCSLLPHAVIRDGIRSAVKNLSRSLKSPSLSAIPRSLEGKNLPWVLSWLLRHAAN